MTRGSRRTGSDSPGVKRQYSGTLGKIGNCQIGVSVHAVGSARDGAVGVGAVSARGLVRGRGPPAPGEDPRARSVSRPSRSSGSSWSSAPAGWEVARRRCSAITRMARTPGCAIASHGAGCEYVLSCRPEDEGVRAGHRSSPCPAKKPGASRGPVTAAAGPPARAGRRADRPTREPAVRRRVTFRDGPDGEPVTSTVRLRSRSRRPRLAGRAGWTGWRERAEVPPREEWLIAEWPDGAGEADRLLDLEPPG